MRGEDGAAQRGDAILRVQPFGGGPQALAEECALGVDEYIIPINPDAADIAGLSDQVANYDLIVVGTIDAGRHLGQAALVNTLLQSQAPVVVVALRLPYDLEAFPNAPTYACTYSILSPALHALAAALFGKIPFAGRLPVTIPGI